MTVGGTCVAGVYSSSSGRWRRTDCPRVYRNRGRIGAHAALRLEQASIEVLNRANGLILDVQELRERVNIGLEDYHGSRLLMALSFRRAARRPEFPGLVFLVPWRPAGELVGHSKHEPDSTPAWAVFRSLEPPRKPVPSSFTYKLPQLSAIC